MKSAQFVTATCACGAQFKREVKRGRPQVWCGPCQEIPYEQRVAKPASPVVETVEGEPVADRPKRPFDSYGYCRDQIEAEVAAVYATWKADFAALKAQGMSDFDAGSVLGEKLKAVYAGYKAVKADGFQDQEDQ